METLVLDQGVHYLEGAEKLTGSVARCLGETLQSLASAGCRVVVLDLGACRSIDSMCVDALAEALDAGLELSLAVGPFFDFRHDLLSLCLDRTGILIHYSLDRALVRRGLPPVGEAGRRRAWDADRVVARAS